MLIALLSLSAVSSPKHAPHGPIVVPGTRRPASAAFGSVHGRTALVTGSGNIGSIGYAIAQALLKNGAAVVLNDIESQEDNLKATAQSLREHFPDSEVTYSAFDVTNEHAVAEAIRKIGRIDILCNNAGINKRVPISETTPELFEAIFRVNTLGPMIVARACYPQMQERGWGRVINMCSEYSMLGRSDLHSYSASKHALLGLTRSLAAEFGAHGVTCNGVGPGYIQTALTQPLWKSPAGEHIRGATPCARWGAPEDIGPAVAFLASEEAAFVNGHLLMVDGGLGCTFNGPSEVPGHAPFSI